MTYHTLVLLNSLPIFLSKFLWMIHQYLLIQQILELLSSQNILFKFKFHLTNLLTSSLLIRIVEFSQILELKRLLSITSLLRVKLQHFQNELQSIRIDAWEQILKPRKLILLLDLHHILSDWFLRMKRNIIFSQFTKYLYILFDQMIGIADLKKDNSSQHLSHYASNWPDIACKANVLDLVVMWGGEVLLWCSIPKWRIIIWDLLSQLLKTKQPCVIEPSDFHAEILVEEYIFWLEIPVGYASRMQVFQPTKDLINDKFYVIFVYFFLLLDELTQGDVSLIGGEVKLS